MKASFTLLALALLFAGMSCATKTPTAEDQPPPTTVPEAIDRSIQPLLDRRSPRIDGIVVGVFRGGAREFVVRGDTDLTPDGLMRVASMTKPLAATLVATYVTEGTLSYDDKVGVGTCDAAKLSAFCFRGAPTTFRHLVQHTAGLPTEPDNLDIRYDEAALQDFLARFQLGIEPGARFRYSTTGYALLGMALERRTRVPFHEALQSRVLAPLSLSSVTFTPDPEALVAGRDDGELVADPARPPVLWPSGGLAATPADLLRFAEANLHPDDTPELAEAIRRTQRVSSDVSAFDSSRVALGWFYLEAADVYWHAGSTTGYSVFTAFSPNTDTAIVLATNNTLPADGTLAVAAFDLLSNLAQLK